MTIEIVYTRRALRSLKDIDDYLEKRSPDGALNVRVEIERTVDLLCDQPGIGIPSGVLGVRIHPTRRYRYRIVYRVSGRTMQVLDVLHRSRLMPPPRV